MQADQEVDVRTLKCPLPILRAKKALFNMESGQILKVLATDPSAPLDFAVFCRQTGHQMVEMLTDQAGHFTFLIRRR